MTYHDYINNTLSHKNEIDWNYYGNHIQIDNLLNSETSSDFIKQYFENGEKSPFDVECDDEIYIHSQKNGEYTFIYSTRLKRLTEATSDNEDIDLDEGIAEIIPYFVKSELIASENSEEANVSRLLFDGILKELTAISRGSTNQVVDTVYFFE